MRNIRHERGSEDLKEESYGHGETGDVAAETAAQRKKTSEEADHREEERDEVEGEHEAGEVVVVARSCATVSVEVKRVNWPGMHTR